MERAELANVLLQMVEEETGEKFENLDDSADLRKTLHLDSLDMVSLVLHVEYHFKIEIDSEELNQVTTVGQLLDLLHVKVNAKPSRAAA